MTSLPIEISCFQNLKSVLGNIFLDKFGILPSYYYPKNLSVCGNVEKILKNGWGIMSIDDSDKKFKSYIFSKNKSFLSLEYNSYQNSYNCLVLSDVKELESIKEFINTLIFHRVKKEKIKDNTFSIGLILPDYGGLKIKYFDIDYISIPITNYSESVKENHKKIIQKLKNESKGLFLFTGEPGTGKTNYLRKLAYEVQEKSFIFINADNAELLGNPNLISALMDEKNSVLVIEDGESSIASRKDQSVRNKFTTNLLNITDGLMSDILKIQVIVTLNYNKENIDEAFKRAGRLSSEVEFKALEKNEANLWLKNNNSSKEVDKECKLCDLYELLN